MGEPNANVIDNNNFVNKKWTWPLALINVPRPKGSTNVWQDVNNPGSIMAESPQWEAYALSLWAVGKYKSPNGRTYAVFPDMKTGVGATTTDISSKLSGWSSWVTPNTTLAQFASWWTSWPNAPLNQWAIANYSKLTGYPSGTKISDIPREKLISAIIKNEWVNTSISNNIT